MYFALGSLRKRGKTAGLTCTNSVNFRRAADSLVAVGNELAMGYMDPPGEPIMERRMFGLKQSAQLLRILKVLQRAAGPVRSDTVPQNQADGRLRQTPETA